MSDYTVKEMRRDVGYLRALLTSKESWKQAHEVFNKKSDGLGIRWVK